MGSYSGKNRISVPGSKYMMSDVPEYVEISGKWLAAEGELREYRDQCLKQGMELMTKYFRNLWD